MKRRFLEIVSIAIVAVIAASSVCLAGGGGGGGGRGGAGGPGGRGGAGGPGGGPGGRSGRGAAGASSFLAAPVPKDDDEKKILNAIRDISQKEGYMLNVPDQDGRMLRLLAESIGAKTVVEFGTSNGISALWFSLALRKTGGKLITHEIDKKTAALARENFGAAGVSDLVTIVEGDAHETASKLQGPIDMIFIDADKEGYVDYLKKVLPLMRPGGLITAHNINQRAADDEFIKALNTNPELETLYYMDGGGLSVSLKKR
jgi:caffeoyl-CoA O-methyltransferase